MRLDVDRLMADIGARASWSADDGTHSAAPVLTTVTGSLGVTSFSQLDSVAGADRLRVMAARAVVLFRFFRRGSLHDVSSHNHPVCRMCLPIMCLSKPFSNAVLLCAQLPPPTVQALTLPGGIMLSVLWENAIQIGLKLPVTVGDQTTSSRHS